MPVLPWKEGAWAPPGEGVGFPTGQGALDGHSEKVLRRWTDQVAAGGSLVTADGDGQVGRVPGACQAPQPCQRCSAGPAPLWPRAACVWLSAELPPPFSPLPPSLFSRFLSSTKPYGSS